jgi:hypothetical protein
MGHRIIITVDKGGKTTSRVAYGLTGEKCATQTAWLNNLGISTHVEPTPEMFESCHSDESEEVDESINTGHDW